MVPIESDEARARAMADGRVDLAHIKPQHMALVQASPGHELHRYPSGIWRSLVLNVRRPHLADRRVRQAIALALDRDAMVREGLLGVGTPAYSPIPPMNWAWSGAPVRPRDVGQARALLDESGWIAGPDAWRRRDESALVLALAVWWTEPFRRAASEVVKRNLEEIGIQVRFVEIPGERYEEVAAALGPEHDAIISGYSGLLDPGDNLATKYRTGGSQNAGGYSNPDVDRLLDAAQREGDRAHARLLYQQALALIGADAARIPLVYVDYLFASRRDLLGMRGNVLDLYYHFPRLTYLLRWAP
jgi:peptide/nickel transport system substrate-binding protein